MELVVDVVVAVLLLLVTAEASFSGASEAAAAALRLSSILARLREDEVLARKRRS